MILASEFVKQCYIPLNDGWGYIWGTWGQMWDEADQRKLEKTTDSNRAKSRKYGSKWIGHRVTDCSGLPRWAFNQFGIKVPHSSHYQWTDCCAKRGELVNGRRDDGIRIRPGTAVFLRRTSDNRRHHVGTYVGGDTVIEAKGAQYGVVTSSLSHWDEWGEWKEVDYSEYPIVQEDIQKMILRKGMTGEAVKRLQEMLIQCGYGYIIGQADGADGVYGDKTVAAVKAFQTNNGLDPDGIAGEKTQKALELTTAKPSAPELPEDDDKVDDPMNHIVISRADAVLVRDALERALAIIREALK